MTKLSILYASCLLEKELELSILCRDRRALGQQIQKFHRLMVNGLVRNGVNVTCLSYHNSLNESDIKSLKDSDKCKPTFSYVLSKRKGRYIGVLIRSYVAANLYFRRHDNCIAICDVLNVTVSLGMLIAAKRNKVKTIGIVTDIPGNIYGRKSHSLNSFMSKIVMNLCNNYVLLTEYMTDFIKSDKEYIVLEGLVDDITNSEDDLLPNNTNKSLVCIYAGNLDMENGIEKLTEAFIKADIDNTELHIYGSGTYEEELRKISNKHIVFHGIQPNLEVVEAEKKASLLINPRPSGGEFTKYSFPSKNMEYMSTGTPVLTTQLPGMPKEYLDYVYVFEDEDVDGMSRTIKDVLSIDADELKNKGLLTKEYVMKRKNNTIQAKRVIDFVKVIKDEQ